jgi:hypothetical protein
MCCEVNQLHPCAKVVESRLLEANLLQHHLVDILEQLHGFIEVGYEFL